ncbi:MAG: hypothetical protein PHX20_05250, partial [Candidatus Omnitrophica bacterium]|nr:hypothetical protein [Candidatus Omnitrophota bacterium]
MRNLLDSSLVIFITVFAFMLDTPSVYPYSDDNSDHYSSSSSSVFAPGYLNAAKYQAEAMLKQQTPKRSFLDNVTEFVMGRTTNKLKAAVQEKAANVPILQRKQSSSKGKNNARLAATLITVGNTNPADIPVHIRNGIQEYINKTVNNQFSDYKIDAANGKYYAVWTESSANSLNFQIFDSNGNTLLGSPTTLTGNTPYGYVHSVTALDNGNTVVIWEDSIDASGGNGWCLKAQAFDSDGNTLSTSPSVITTDVSHMEVCGVNKLSDGSMTIFWNEEPPAPEGMDPLGEPFFSNEQSLKFQKLDSNGNVLLTSPMNLVTTTNPGTIRVETLDNGNTAVFWETSELSKACLNFQIFDSNGNGVFDSPNSLASEKRYAYASEVMVLSNGNIAVLWREGNSGSNESMKFQVFDADGTALYALPATLISNNPYASRYSVTELENGNIAVFWEDSSSMNHALKFQVLDSDGKALFDSPTTLATSYIYNMDIDKVTVFANGNVAVFWTVYESGDYLIKYQVLDSSGNMLFESPAGLTTNGAVPWVDEVKVLDNGNIAVFWTEYGSSQYNMKFQILDSAGSAVLASPISVKGAVRYIRNITTLDNGDIVIFLTENYSNCVLTAQVFDSYGNPQSSDILQSPSRITSLSDLGHSIINNPAVDPFSADLLNDDAFYGLPAADISTGGKDLSGIFKTFLGDSNILGREKGTPETTEGIIKNILGQQALSLPEGQIGKEEIDAAMRLASAIKNPAGDQKMILAAIKLLLVTTDKIKDGEVEAGNSELKKAEDRLLNAVANMLLTQALPDLLKKGDIANIENIFSELNVANRKILAEYEKASKPYYENILKDLSKNMAILQLKNVLSGNIS